MKATGSTWAEGGASAAGSEDAPDVDHLVDLVDVEQDDGAGGDQANAARVVRGGATELALSCGCEPKDRGVDFRSEAPRGERTQIVDRRRVPAELHSP